MLSFRVTAYSTSKRWKTKTSKNLGSVNRDQGTKRMQMKDPNSMKDPPKKSEDQDAKILKVAYGWKRKEVSVEHICNMAQYICIQGHNTKQIVEQIQKCLSPSLVSNEDFQVIIQKKKKKKKKKQNSISATFTKKMIF